MCEYWPHYIEINGKGNATKEGIVLIALVDALSIRHGIKQVQTLLSGA